MPLFPSEPTNDFFSGLLVLLVLAVLGGLMLRATVNHRDTLLWQIRLFVVALVLRFSISVVIYEFGLVKVLGDEDASGWYGGVLLLFQWTTKHIGFFGLPQVLFGAFDTSGGVHLGYKYMLALLFYFTDSPARMPAAALNAFFGALTAVFVYRIAKSLFSPWVAKRAGWLVCFFPSLVVWSAQTVKEPVIILLETVALYACVRLKRSGFSLRYIAASVGAIILLIPFRFYACYIVGAAVVLSLVIPQFQRGKTTVLTAIAVGSLIAGIVLGGGFWAQSEAQFERFDMNRVERFKSDLAFQAGSGVKNDYDLHTITGFVSAVTVGGLNLLLAPFPWQLAGGHMRMLLSIPELLIWWWLVFAGLIPGVIHAFKTRFFEIQPAVFFILGMGLLYSMTFGNVGLVFRQRAQLLPWLLIFVVVGLEQRVLRKRSRQRQSARGNAILGNFVPQAVQPATGFATREVQIYRLSRPRLGK